MNAISGINDRGVKAFGGLWWDANRAVSSKITPRDEDEQIKILIAVAQTLHIAKAQYDAGYLAGREAAANEAKDKEAGDEFES